MFYRAAQFFSKPPNASVQGSPCSIVCDLPADLPTFIGDIESVFPAIMVAVGFPKATAGATFERPSGP
jgi:hypothetical protein